MKHFKDWASVALVLLTAIGGVWLIALNNPFDSRRWGPVLYPPTHVVPLFGVGMILLLLLLVLVFRVAHRTSLGTGGRWLVAGSTCLVYLTLLQLIVTTEIRKNLAFRPHPLLDLERTPHNSLQETNSHGLPGEEFPAQKPAGELRIAVLGDCAGLALGERLQIELARTHPHQKIRIINASLTGYSILTSVRNIHLRLQKLDPDFFIACHINDLEMVPIAESDAYPMTPLVPLKILMYRSDLYLCLRKIVINSTAQTQIGDAKPVRRVSDEELVHCYREFLESSRTKGKRSVLISMPRLARETGDPWLERHQRLQKLCEQHHGVMVDVLHAVEGRPDLASLFGADGHHPSPAGIEVVLKLLLQALEKHKLLTIVEPGSAPARPPVRPDAGVWPGSHSSPTT